MMGGTLEATSREGLGSTFQFDVLFEVGPETGLEEVPEDLPSTQTQPPGVLPREPTSRGSARQARILVVEDNQTNQWVARHVLERLGHRVEVAADGARALGILATRPFDLVLMDCQMPGLDGYETTRRIRSGKHQADVPIIAMTAYAMMGDRERCLAAGMDDYLSKPIDRKLLTSVLGHWLRSVVGRDEGEETASASPAEGEAASADEATAPRDDGAVDTGIFSELEADPQAALELLDLFAADARTLISEVRDELAAKNLEAIRARIHSLKGSSGSVGATALSHHCADLLRDPTLESFSEGLDSLEHELRRALTALDHQLGSG